MVTVMTETNQAEDAQFSPTAFLAEGCRRLISGCEHLEKTLSEKCAELKDLRSHKDVAFRKLEEARAELKEQTNLKEVALRELSELQAQWRRLQADYDKLSKPRLSRLAQWFRRFKDRRRA